MSIFSSLGYLSKEFEDLCEISQQAYYFKVKSCYPKPNPQIGGSLLVGCPLGANSIYSQLTSIRNHRARHAVVTRDLPNIRNQRVRHAVVTRDLPNILNQRARHAMVTRDPPNIRNLRARHAVVTREPTKADGDCLLFLFSSFSFSSGNGSPVLEEVKREDLIGIHVALDTNE
jgi:hypothetical protein